MAEKVATKKEGGRGGKKEKREEQKVRVKVGWMCVFPRNTTLMQLNFKAKELSIKSLCKSN
ncbi:uncharacterized protein G2W53_033078 [Senna tora]|uniref:Uncharacterized protein n=1 Tax=Senna tora TaxID=362788 RepID=A0A834T1J4_9FABA|nr:uncharacterized protein G2W53_033078 [Senna tora]